MFSMVQPRKIQPDITEKLLTVKNQTKQIIKCVLIRWYMVYIDIGYRLR